VINGERSDLALCQNCAEALGMDGSAAENPAEIAQMIANFMREMHQNPEDLPDIECGNCGCSFKDFHKRGLLGCPQCYGDFSEYLKPLIRRYHGVTAHHSRKTTGKTRSKSEIKMANLRINLKKALSVEDFETAAKIRDELKQFEK